MKRHRYNTQPAIKQLLLERANLKGELDVARVQRNQANANAREANRAAAATESMLHRQRQLVRALRWKDPQNDDVEIRYAVHIPRDQVMGRHDPEHLWAEALTQLGVDLTTALAKFSMANVTKVLWGRDAKTFYRAKREWMMNQNTQNSHLDYESLSSAWDAAVEAVLATAKQQ